MSEKYKIGNSENIERKLIYDYDSKNINNQNYIQMQKHQESKDKQILEPQLNNFDGKIISEFIQTGKQEKINQELSRNINNRLSQNKSKDKIVQSENNINSEIELLKQDLDDNQNRLNIMTNKFMEVKKKNQIIEKEKKILEDEVNELCLKMTSMVPGCDSQCAFPLQNELSDKANDFYRGDILDIFLDVLSTELSIEGVLWFFSFIIEENIKYVNDYFNPLWERISSTLCLEDVKGPVLNVIRKTAQNRFQPILNKCKPDILSHILIKLELGKEGDKQQITNYLKSFLQKYSELLLCLFLADPPLNINHNRVGSQELYQQHLHDVLDGFVKVGDSVVVIVPEIRKFDGTIFCRSIVLNSTYEIN